MAAPCRGPSRVGHAARRGGTFRDRRARRHASRRHRRNRRHRRRFRHHVAAHRHVGDRAAALGLPHATISAPGKRASTAATSGSARTPVLSSAGRASFWAFTVGWPCSAETTTIQRRLVHCENLRARSLTSVFAALFSSAIFEPAVLAAHQPHVALERGLDADVALLRRERDQILETADAPAARRAGRGARARLRDLGAPAHCRRAPRAARRAVRRAADAL